MEDFPFNPEKIKSGQIMSVAPDKAPDFPFSIDKISSQLNISNKQTGKVKSWSYSSLKTFEKCKYQTYLKSVEKNTPRIFRSTG